MIILGFVLLALAVAAAIVLIAQNPDAMMTLHALGNTYTTHAYWVFVGGMVVLAVFAIGVSMMRAGASHGARVRRERRDLAAENARLNERVASTPAADDTRVVDDRGYTDGQVSDERVVEEPARSHHMWSRRTTHGTV